VGPVSALKYALLPLDVEVIEVRSGLPGNIVSNLEYLTQGLVKSHSRRTQQIRSARSRGRSSPALLLKLARRSADPKPQSFSQLCPPRLGLPRTLKPQPTT
jgi:hypothetical protein